MDVVESLKAELAQVTEKLAALEQIKNDRATLTAQASRLTKAIAMLSGEPAVRKPMSDEAKARIKAGLEKARAAKLATGGIKPENKIAPASSDPATAAKRAVAVDKGASRAS